MRLILILLASLLLSGCQTGYFALMDKAGISRREMLVHRVQDARDAQVKARYAFSRAEDRYQAALHPSGNAPEVTLEQLHKAYADSDKAAAAVAPRVDNVEQVGDALFAEWRDELGRYKDPNLAASSRDEYQHSLAQYQQMLRSMRDAQSQVAPALAGMSDQMLQIKHRRNAQAISDLEDSERSVEGDLQPLLIDLQRSIDQAAGFAQTLQP